MVELFLLWKYNLIEMDNITYISILGLTIDLIVSAAFAVRLFLHRKETNRLFRLFSYFFSLIAAFCLITLVYLSFPHNQIIFKIFFLLSFGFLFAIAIDIWAIIFEIINTKYNRIVFWFWVVMSLVNYLYLLIHISPYFNLNMNYAWPTFSFWLSFMIIGIPFFGAACVFFYKAAINKDYRQRYFFFGLAFLLIILGGPLHKFRDIQSGQLYLFADILTTLGFTSAFFALIKKE
jgi:hypothetical protein